MSPKRIARSACFLLLLFLPAVAAAEPTSKTYEPCARKPSDTDVTAAKGAFQAGNASFDEADYPRAIVYWEDAYRRDCTAHALLLNLARAYELNGDKRLAAGALEAYLERVPSAPDKAKIQRRIDVLHKAAEPEVKPAPAATVLPDPEPLPPDPADAGDATVMQQLTLPTTEPERSRPIAPLIVAGAGVAVAAVGAVLYFRAQSDLDKAEAACPNHRCPSDSALVDEANQARTRVNVSAGVTIGGLAVAGGGVAWYLLSPAKPRAVAALPALLPSFGTNFAGLELNTRF